MNKTKVIYDATVLVSGHTTSNLYKTGLFRVAWELLNQLAKDNFLDIYLYDVFHREREVKKYLQPQFGSTNRIKIYSDLYQLLIFPLGNMTDSLRVRQGNTKSKILIKILGFLKVVLLYIEKGARKIERRFVIKTKLKETVNNMDVYYSTYFPIPPVIRENKEIRKVYTLHDLIPIIHPEYFYSPYNEKLVREVMDSIEKNDFAIAVSQSTKDDMLKYRPDLNPEHIRVAHLAASDNFYKVEDMDKLLDVKKKYRIKSAPYILSLCTIEPRKNLGLLVSAFKEIIKDKTENELQLVLIGSYGWDSNQVLDEIQKINAKHPESIVLAGFVPDEDLAALYSAAMVFVYPSLYEGFGLPVLEAMKCGVAVITSNRSSLPEVAGNAGITVDPCDVNELRDSINEIYKNEKLREQLALNSYKRSQYFSWGATSKHVIEMIKMQMSPLR